jgi:hypothetical protein
MNGNGRITFSSNTSYDDYKMTIQDNIGNFADKALQGIIQCSPVSRLFFSELNIKALQRGIKNMVLNKSCGKIVIGDQSLNELLTVMRSIYLQESRYSNVMSHVEQVKKLNEKVLYYTVPRILSEFRMHKAYIDRITSLPVPMEYGQATSLAGSKTLEQKIF